MIGEEEQAEPYLGDQQGLRECEQVRDDAVGLAAAVIREAGEPSRAERRSQDEECHGVVGR